jgi:hypothetical protein
MRQLVKCKLNGKTKELEESHPSATPRCPDLESNPGSCGEEQASNRLSCGTDFVARSLIKSNETVTYCLYIIAVTLGAI